MAKFEGKENLSLARICMSIESETEADALKDSSWGIHAEDDGGFYLFTITRMIMIPRA